MIQKKFAIRHDLILQMILDLFLLIDNDSKTKIFCVQEW